MTVADLTTKQELALYRSMASLRRFEDTVQQMFLEGIIQGTTHLYTGQEAIAVGVASSLSRGDKVAATYRGHGHALALGLSPQLLMDEMLGKSTGVCGGRAGSMNVVDLEHGLIGSFGIVGGSIAAATGAALALKGTGSVAVAFFGDGTANQGYFFECLNFAKVHELPMLFFCENNLYGEFTPWEDVTAGMISHRSRAMNIPTVTIDGNDVWTVQKHTREVLEGIRSGSGPAFIEGLTYRHVGHSRNDPGHYRKPGELKAWKERDPLIVARKKMVEQSGIDASLIDRIDREVAEEIDEVRQRGMAAPYPDVPAQATEFRA